MLNKLVLTYPIRMTCVRTLPCNVLTSQEIKLWQNSVISLHITASKVVCILLFIIYVADLVDIVGRHGVTLHSFADDVQWYLQCHREDTTAAAASWQTVLSMSADGWPPTDWDSTRTRPNSFGLGRDTACPNSRVWVQLCNWVQTLLQHVTRSGCSGSPSLPI